jgi:hypothetical protein
MPQVIKYRDENIMNHKIENLYESDHIGSMNHKEFKGYTFANNSYKVRAMVD